MVSRRRIFASLVVSLFIIALFGAAPSFAQQFKVGFAKRDITPTKPVPMWGYGARHNALSQGVLDPLYAKALVIDVGTAKLALVGLDLGRSPTPTSMETIRKAVKDDSDVEFLMICGSHTHHGPVIELKDEPGKGKGTYDDAVAYVKDLDRNIIDAINEAAQNVQDARLGWGSAMVNMNRNRHSKIEPKPTDPELSVVRFDDRSGNPIAILVNFAAHPTMLPAQDLRFSADYPGQMMNAVEQALETNCLFIQGAAGDLSVRTTEETRGIEAFGKALAEEVLSIARDIETSVPEKPSIQGMDEEFAFPTRLDLTNPMVRSLYSRAFFPELVATFWDEVPDNIVHGHLTTVLVNGSLALVGGSGEFFCNHANRLKQRSRADKTLFFGYCNGHQLYYPTIEAAAEGGYGADPSVSWVALGAGEQMMNKALINIYTMMGKYEFAIPTGRK